MNDERYEFTRVNALAGAGVPDGLSFVTDGQRRLRVGGLREVDRLDMKLVTAAAATHGVIFVAFDPTTSNVRFAAPFDRARVVGLRPIDSSTDIEVSLILRPSFMRLQSSHPRFAELRRLLEGALRTRERIWVGSFPGDRDIKDVRLAPASDHPDER